MKVYASNSYRRAIWNRPAGTRPKAPKARKIQAAPKASRRITEELRRIDAQVKIHEQTHLALLGPYASGAVSYSYMRGPDGQMYAVGGSIGVDTSPVPGDPEATIRKARMLRLAAFGPMQPSSADMQVAADAYRMEMEARREIEQREAEQEQEKEQEKESYSARIIDIYV